MLNHIIYMILFASIILLPISSLDNKKSTKYRSLIILNSKTLAKNTFINEPKNKIAKNLLEKPQRFEKSKLDEHQKYLNLNINRQFKKRDMETKQSSNKLEKLQERLRNNSIERWRRIGQNPPV